MLKITPGSYENIMHRLVHSNEIISLAREFSKDPDYFYSILNDISKGKSSDNYGYIKGYAGKMNIAPDFIVSIASFLLSDRKKYEKDYYRVLDVDRSASSEEIRKSWIRLLKGNHPDLIGEQGIQRTKELNEAYGILNNDIERSVYDASYFNNMDVVVIRNLKIHSNEILTIVIVLLLSLFTLIGYLHTFNENLTAGNKEISATNGK